MTFPADQRQPQSTRSGLLRLLSIRRAQSQVSQYTTIKKFPLQTEKQKCIVSPAVVDMDPSLKSVMKRLIMQQKPVIKS